MSATEVNVTARELNADELARIAKLEASIQKSQERIAAIRAGKPEKTKAEAYVPEVGAFVLATVGRNTATSQAKVVEGQVTAVKVGVAGEDGKVSATQVRVRIYEGTFDEQLVTLYPAQLKPNAAKMEDNVSDERAIGELPDAS